MTSGMGRDNIKSMTPFSSRRDTIVGTRCRIVGEVSECYLLLHLVPKSLNPYVV